MFCTKCGAKLADNCKFCTSCGSKINYSVTNTQQQNMMSNEELKLRMQAQQMQIQQQQLQMQAQQLQLQQQQFNAMIKCPRCGSTSISANKKGYGVVKGGLGAIAAIGLAPVTGGASLAAGAIGAGAGNIGRNKVICTCMNCGYKFKAGKK